jgi:hypothetical protein
MKTAGSPDSQSTGIEFRQETVRIPCEQAMPNRIDIETDPKGRGYEEKHRRYSHCRIAHD